jgi:hypothetical protein
MNRPRWANDKLALVLFALAHVGIFAGLFRSVYNIPYSGTGLFYDYAGKVLSGLLPYRDFVLEYPPFALVFFTLPRILGESFRWYYVWFQTQVVVFDLLTLGTLYVAARWWSLSVWRVLGVYTVVVLAVGPITLHQYDIFPATFSVLAIVWFARGRDFGAWVFLALGLMTKVYPILLAPVFIILDWRANRRRFARAAIAFASTCIVVLLPWLVTAPTSLRVLVNYHTKRGIHLDSTYGTLAFIAQGLGLGLVDVRMSFASWNLAGRVPDALATVSTFVLAVTLIVVYAIIARRAKDREMDVGRDVEFVAHSSALILVASMAASKVLSPQYLIWVMVMIPLVTRPHRLGVWILFTAIGVLTYYMYPHHYNELLAGRTAAVVGMGLRNALLIVLAVVLAIALRRVRASEDSPHPLPAMA